MTEPPPRPRRDERIDFWRGLCIVGMVIWHLLTHPAFPHWLSFGVIQGFNFVAEGFVLLAGTAVGLVVARMPGEPLRVGHYLRRAGVILLVHWLLAAVLLFVFAAKNGHGRTPDPTCSAALAPILLLRYQPYLGDVLSVFVFLFAATPLLLAVRRQFGPTVLLALSLALYAAANLLPLWLPDAWVRLLEPNDRGAFDFGSWQLVFVCGILLGGRHETVFDAWRRSFWQWTLPAAAAFLAIGAYRAAAELNVAAVAALPEVCRFDRHPLTPPRAVYIGLQMLLIALLTIRFWDHLSARRIVRLLVTFGQNSLTVFACSVPLDYALKATIGRLHLHFPTVLLLLAVDLGLLYLVARYFRRPRRR